jgi:low temperature requirement protein LtrA
MTGKSPLPRPLGSAHRVSAAELFFDLIFVFAFTQVTTLLAAAPTPLGFVHGLVVLGIVWWAWGSFAWLTNARAADSTAMRLILLAGMAGMLVVGLAVPTAFENGALLFAGGIAVTRIVWIIAYRLASRGDPDYAAAVRRLTLGAIVVPAALIVGAVVGSPLQLWIWLAALVFDYVTPILARPRGWKVDPAHFSERYGLIVIIALGEAVVAVGLATAGAESDTPGRASVLGSMIGLVIAALMWALYFSHLAELGERALQRTEGVTRTLIARDAYTYAHILPVAGIVLTALGAKEVMHHPLESALPVIVVALCLGVSTYLAGIGVIAWRVTRVTWLSTWIAGAVLALVGLAAVPSWRSGAEEMPVMTLPGIAVLALVAVALAFAAFVKPPEWRSVTSTGL